MRKLLVIIITTLLSVSVWAQTTKPTVRTKLAIDTIMIGDQISMEVLIDKDIATEVMVPEFKEGKLSPEVEILGMPRFDTLQRNGRLVTLRLNYTITSFTAGTHRIGGFPVVVEDKRGNDTIMSQDLMELTVKTFDIDTTKQQIVDIKQPLDTPLQWAEIKDIFFYSLAGVVILAIIIYFFIKFIKSRKRKTKSRPDEPAHLIAIRELEQLYSEKLPQAGRFKEYYSRITDILREYMDNRYGIWAMEMTTPQIIDAIKEVNEPNSVSKLGNLFSLADLVKFAKWTPTVDECEEAFQTAYYYVEETKVLVINTNIEQDA